VEQLRHGYTNDTRGDGQIVIKRYRGQDAPVRRATERRALGALAGILPVPALMPTGDPETLGMAHVHGVQGQELIDAGHGRAVLASCGALLARLQSVEVAAVHPGTAGVLVHGDFGPNNMLFDPGDIGVTAVLDWEWSGAGDPVEDLAWCEWIVRTHHPHSAGDLDALFRAYGDRPAWARRRQAMLGKCRQMLERCLPSGDRSPAAISWRERIAATESWTDPI